MISLIFAATLLFAANASVEAPTLDCSLSAAEDVVVAKVIDAGSFKLADGRNVRLAAIRPLLSGQPFAEGARAELSNLLLGKHVQLAFDARSVDRHGELIAHVYVDAVWVQARLIEEGLARVQTQPDIKACARALLQREQESRTERKGLWADVLYRLRTPDDLPGDIGTFQIMEGAPKTVVKRRDRTYVNFGADYRTDFTATIGRRDLKYFAAAGADPKSWAGKKIRVRGWLSLLNGPEIELTHPEQVEVLEESKPQ